MAKRSPISATAKLLCKVTTDGVFDHAIHTVVVKSGPRHFGTWDGTVRHLGQDSSAHRSELSLGHLGTSADLSGQFGLTKLVPKCPGSEVSWVRSVRNSPGPIVHQKSPFQCTTELRVTELLYIDKVPVDKQVSKTFCHGR